MITFDALTLKAFIKESKDFLEGARIQKIQQPTRRDFIFVLRNQGESKKLYININPQMYHLCFMSEDNEKRRIIEIPKQPPMFCMLLRKHLENSKICRVNQPENERIFELYIETYNELNEKIYLCLAVELMGKHSNVILYNYDTNIILGCAHNVGSEKSRERELAGTLPYTYPPKQIKLDIKNYNGVIDYKKLGADFYMFSRAFADLCIGQTRDKLVEFINLENLSPAISDDYSKYSLYEELIPNSCIQKSVNSMIDNYYAHYQARDKFLSEQSHLLTHTKQRLKRTLNSVQKMQTQIQRESDCDKYRLYGDLIIANLYNNSDYSAEIEVYDYENGQKITIELDSTKTLKENANKYYKLYNKGKTSKDKLTEQKEDLIQIKTYLEQLEYSIYTARNYEDLSQIKSEVIGTKEIKKKKIKAAEPEKIVKGDCVIYIGKNNRQNDYIISKLAKDEDYWFHTKDCAGSHVLLRCEKPSSEIILECAELAKTYSSASKSSKVGVIYTQAKNLRKPPKAALGYVTYKNEKEIIVD